MSRRAMLISRGDITVFVQRPISAAFIALCVILIGTQIYFRLRGSKANLELAVENAGATGELSTKITRRQVADPAE